MSQKTMDMNNLGHLLGQTLIESKKSLVHNKLDDNGYGRLSQDHDHHEKDPREQSPGRAEDEIARSGVDIGCKYAKAPVDNANQVTGQTKLRGPVVSMNEHRMR